MNLVDMVEKFELQLPIALLPGALAPSISFLVRGTRSPS